MKSLVIRDIYGYAGIRLLEGKPLEIRPGINLLVGRNGSGKSNLIRLIQYLVTSNGDIRRAVESSVFKKYAENTVKSDKEIHRAFGSIELVKYLFMRKKFSVSAHLSTEKPVEKFVLENVKNSPESFHSFLSIDKPPFDCSWNWIGNNDGIRNMNMSGHHFSNLLSKQQDKDITRLFDEPVEMVNEFVRAKMREFFSSSDFKNQLDELENSMNSILGKFLLNTNKRICLLHDMERLGSIKLTIKDGDNYIDPQVMSSGENVLLNLIYSLTTAKTNQYDFVALDEPELHMHDDMIEVLVEEIDSLSKEVPDCSFLIATHSTSLIEQLANLDNSPNLILFDESRNVSNSEYDIDFIKALKRNGVWFTPLMLSKKHNLFIENDLNKGVKHRNLLLSFFKPGSSAPNIIPIGTSDNVLKSDNFSMILEDLIPIESMNSIGIRDGDLWFKKHLFSFLKDELDLNSLLSLLPDDTELYIRNTEVSNQYYFNFWEIENIYLFDEMLPCWVKKENSLNREIYVELLQRNRSKITRIYLHNFFKKLSYSSRFDRPSSIEQDAKRIEATNLELAENVKNIKALENKISLLIDSLIERNLLRWLPGKEIDKMLRGEGYEFDDTEFDHINSTIGLRLQKIIE